MTQRIVAILRSIEPVDAIGILPGCNPGVIRASHWWDMLSCPRVFTSTECFAALRAGADGFGIGSALYRPENSTAVVGEKVCGIVERYNAVFIE